MMKNYLLFIVLISSYQSFSQEIYLSTGKNFTNYNYKNSFGESNPNLKSGTGNFYEIGFTKPFKNKQLLYSLGLSLNDYNAVGGTAANTYRWDTKYLGIKGGVSYSFFPKGDSVKNLDVLLNTGLMGESIIYGKQEIDGAYYDLVHEKEFSGLLFETYLGIQVKYQMSTFGFLSLGYNFSQSINISNKKEEKLLFNTNQIRFGVHFPINSSAKKGSNEESIKKDSPSKSLE